MAEPFGIAAGAVGIAAAFTACTELISLDCVRLRLTRWGQAVNIHEDPRMGRPDATSSEVQSVQNALYQILVLFADTEKISRTYKLESNTGTDFSVLTPNNLDPMVFALQNKMQKLAIRRQKGASILKTGSWALYRRSELKNLVSGITSLVDNIEKLFPASEAQLTLVKQETLAVQDRRALELLESAADCVDSLLLAATKEALTGHQYLDVVIKGKGQIGDAISTDWKGEAKGACHKFDRVVVDENFWDD
ncbi:small s protein [Clathrospora elynae]|uniref:Small s protein n=1 Tax=Clathrospora elynae TaxID=706981 RepID=A0A6A5S5Q1_9PLEO|nr:small s protein [Clathrospora elynae]